MLAHNVHAIRSLETETWFTWTNDTSWQLWSPCVCRFWRVVIRKFIYVQPRSRGVFCFFHCGLQIYLGR